MFGQSFAMVTDEAHEYLSSLLNHNFRVHTTDGRIFLGSFKCTDPDRNIVLSNTFEYREPEPADEHQSAAAADAMINDRPLRERTSRYLGLVVVPGHHIVKIEVEQFTSQMRNRAGIV